MNGSASGAGARSAETHGAAAEPRPALPEAAGDGEGLRSRTVLLLLALLPLLAGSWYLSTLRPVDVTRPAAFAAVLLAASGWGIALWCSRRVQPAAALTFVFWAVALVLRLTFLASEPGLSDDIHRYVWEGALVGAGVDPYVSAPDAPELAEFRARWPATHRRVNHPDVPAAYPPLAQAVHAAAVAAAGAEDPERARLLLRALFACCDLLLCVPLGVLLRRRGLSPMARVAWAWNPWVALEFAGSGHFDALALLLLVTALAVLAPGATERLSRNPGAAGRDIASQARGLEGSMRARLGECCRERVSGVRAGVGLALLVAGAAVKLLPGVILPFALRRMERPWRGLALVVLVAALVALPFVLLTGAWPRSAGLGEYALRWESSSLLFRWIEPLLPQHLVRDESFSDPRRLARLLVLALWLVPLAVAWVARLELERVAAWAVAGFLLLTPTLHPWYLLWMVPFLALRPSLAFGLLIGAAPLFYWPLAGWRRAQVWEEPAWLWPALAGPFLVLLLREGLRAWRGARR